MSLQKKKILVTGGAGFIGSSLVRQLAQKKANVTVYDNLSTGDLANLSDVRDHLNFIKGDVLNLQQIQRALTTTQPDILFHLVADPYVPNSYQWPDKVFNLIVNGTNNVLIAAHAAHVHRTVFLSSGEIYGSYRYLPIDEDHPTNPLSVYSLAKLTADRHAAIFQQEHYTPLINIRLFNCYGPRETHPYIIPDLILQCSKGNTIRVGNLHSKRAFLYVDDATNAMISISTKQKAEGHAFNLGATKSHSVHDLITAISQHFGHTTVHIRQETHRIRKLDPPILECDTTKLKDYIDWEPEYSFEQGLTKTIHWFNTHGQQWPWKNY